MKDCDGNKLEVGDRVAVMSTDGKNLIPMYIVAMHKKMISVGVKGSDPKKAKKRYPFRVALMYSQESKFYTRKISELRVELERQHKETKDEG